MKKWMGFSLTFVLLLGVLAGCSGTATNGNGKTEESSAPSNNQEQKQGESKNKVKLSLGLWDKNAVPAFEVMMEKFHAKHDNIEVSIELTPWDQYWMKMEAAATGGALPDVFWMNGPNFVKYASNGIIMPLQERINGSNMSLENYPQALINLYSYENSSYAIPFSFDTIGLWYNKKMFDAANLDYPDASWDWAKFKDAAVQLTDKDAGIYGFTADLWNQGGYYNTIYQNGGFVISDDKKSSGYDQQEAIEGLKFWTDFIEQGISPTSSQLSETPGVTIFESGKSALYFGGSWIQSQFSANDAIRDDLDVTDLPKGKKQATIIHGLGFAMAANTKHSDEAWTLIQYLSSEEAQQILGSTGTTIPAFKNTQDAWVNSAPAFNLQVFVDAANYAVPLPVSKNTAKWQDKEFELFSKAWEGQISIENAAKQLGEFMNKALEEE
ncbi:ABC transporter substrate-binding protein [Paenibacillus sp. GXUN7292]|uniref:ABC transporter substrate-binding protein n=1 Tax=Paenibacillus sp. GXUN7292 TaxID=3422499 RepID=UPI003D7D0D00